MSRLDEIDTTSGQLVVSARRLSSMGAAANTPMSGPSPRCAPIQKPDAARLEAQPNDEPGRWRSTRRRGSNCAWSCNG